MKKQILRRNTKQKEIILEELAKVKTHPTADSIFKMVRQRIPSISFGTVYRNLNLLRNEGKVLELTCGKYSCRYDATVDNHYHFTCLKCKKLFDANVPIQEDINKQVSKKLKFKIKYHRIEFYGYCHNCKVD